MFNPVSEVKVLFSMFGEDFPLEEIPKALGIKPTETYQTGDVISDKIAEEPKYHKETVWNMGTGYEKSYDVKEQLDKVLKPLLNKKEEIIGIKKKYGIECRILIFVIIEKGEAPAMYLEKEYIDFVSLIGAEIQWDLYANPYVSDF
ncbi:uncharacterized protein DUF4279 [Planomicrobium soli]|uniref:Uncharacterized protein DUF4279 n=1 Tax=Planomicrobium soli TaxID=1176648 RepID=A0A2P8H6E0_9BACL|nr:DUF4279 domain-containing protein [Planomicrobium soli]PSL41788.1 uncharacterized protein DUF4279 [Planomicrobium soli]